MKIEKRWIVSFAIISITAITALFWKNEEIAPNINEFLSEDKIVGADVAWILTASGLVLLMTPELCFFN